MQQQVSQSNEAIVRAFPAFAQLPDTTIEVLAWVLTVKPLPRGILFEAKSEGNELFFSSIRKDNLYDTQRYSV
jgi:hypothetical protein